MIEIKEKCIYFADPMGDLKEDLQYQVQEPLAKNGLLLKKCEVTDVPPWESIYDILFFDWGGMSIGNDLLGSFCRNIVEDAEKYPNRCFVMVSEWTKEAMEDAQLEFSEKKFHNIFLDIKSFADYYKMYFKEQFVW